MPLVECGFCEIGYLHSIKRFLDDDEESLKFLRRHNVIPESVECPRCKEDCVLNEEGIFRCYRKIAVKKKKKKKVCNFSVSQFRGTFLSKSKISPSKILVFVSHFLSSHWDHSTVIDDLNISSRTSMDWHSFCAEVCEKWYWDQPPI